MRFHHWDLRGLRCEWVSTFRRFPSCTGSNSVPRVSIRMFQVRASRDSSISTDDTFPVTRTMGTCLLAGSDGRAKVEKVGEPTTSQDEVVYSFHFGDKSWTGCS